MRKFWTLVSSRRGRGMLMVVVLAACGAGAVNLDHRTVRQRADDWAVAHASSAPTTLEELAAFPAEYRQSIFNHLPAAEQSRLWQVQLQRVLDTEPLTGEQRAYVATLMTLATPQSFMKDMPTPEVCEDIARLFPNPAQKEKVRNIATVAAPARSFAATWVKTTERMRSSLLVGAAQFDCSCRGMGFCECALVASCQEGDCNKTMNCGCLWAGECDKMCQGPLPDMNRVIK